VSRFGRGGLEVAVSPIKKRRARGSVQPRVLESPQARESVWEAFVGDEIGLPGGSVRGGAFASRGGQGLVQGRVDVT